MFHRHLAGGEMTRKWKPVEGSRLHLRQRLGLAPSFQQKKQALVAISTTHLDHMFDDCARE